MSSILKAYLKDILFGDSLEAKLQLPPKDIQFSFDREDLDFRVPGRSQKLRFSEERVRFPKVSSLNQSSQRGRALHFFANHELLAIEIMAMGLLRFPHNTENEKKFKRWLLGSLLDEQKHLSLYIQRMNELGVEFGDFPLNDFFWKHFVEIKSIDQYCASMSLTFEMANLDFSKFYGKAFLENEDEESADLMEVVYRDEIKHVALGKNWFYLTYPGEDLWKLYLENLPWPLSPMRAKGQIFDKDGRRKAGLDESLIESLENYTDDYAITHRKSWKRD